MGTRINGGFSALIVAGLLGAWTGVATAQTTQPAPQPETIPTVQQQMTDTFFGRDRDFFENQRFPRSILWITGPFPENEMASDGDNLNELYEELLSQQIDKEPALVRHPDMASPYTSSLLTEPIYTEESVPPAPVSPFQRSFGSDAVSPPPPPSLSAPVPALW
jgi:hypothetical protein